MNRRSFLLGAVAASALLAAAPQAMAAHTGVTVGAIRWDAAYGPSAAAGTVRGEMEVALSPSQFQGRAPACAVATNTPTSSTVSFAGCSTQSAIDAEINAASAVGLDYWAFCYYGQTGGNAELTAALNYYLSSTIKNKINYALMYFSTSLFVSDVGTTANLNALVSAMGSSNWQKTTISGTARPLLYILLNSGSATAAQVSSAVASLKAAASAAGVATPYVIGLDPGTLAGSVALYGLDAIGSYAYISPSTGTYAAGYAGVEAYWATLAATGQAMIPTAITGWDLRPRKARPHEFQQTLATSVIPYAGLNNYVSAGTPAQIATHIGDMVTWMKANAASNPAQTGLVYSWSEYDEGGSTLSPTLGGNNAILTVVGGAL